jgi:hypothetical protein
MIRRLRMSIHRAIAAALAAFALAGCTTTVVRSGGMKSGPDAATKAPQPYTEDFINSLDPCADQMQDLCGALFLYDKMKHVLPPRLEDLQQVATGLDLKFTCPVSGKPYIYAREGLEAPGQTIRIYVYDAAPAHVFYNKSSNPWSNPKSYGRPNPADGGSRMSIFTKPDAATGAPTLFTDEIPERAFKQFRPAATPEPPATQPAPPPVAPAVAPPAP